MSKKNLKEEEDLEINVSTDDYKKFGDRIDSAAGDDGTVILNKDTMTEDAIEESIKLPINDILKNLGIDLFNKSPEQKAKLLTITKHFVGNLREFGVNIVVSEGDDETENFDDGEFERESNRIEHGVGMHEDENFDSLLEDLSKKNGPKVNIKEDINPRIKKNDLINYLNKK